MGVKFNTRAPPFPIIATLATLNLLLESNMGKQFAAMLHPSAQLINSGGHVQTIHAWMPS
jgi:hypothetical protein